MALEFLDVFDLYKIPIFKNSFKISVFMAMVGFSLKNAYEYKQAFVWVGGS